MPKKNPGGNKFKKGKNQDTNSRPLVYAEDDVDMQYIAYLMYDMISNESYLLKPQPLAEQVFNSLHWSVQKIFKVAIKKINKYTNDILNFSEKEISYEKRILLLKTDDYVKSRAMEKYKEYCKF